MSKPDLRTAAWRTSSYSNGQGGNCVEVAGGIPHTVPVRDSKDATGPALLIPTTTWQSFITGLKESNQP